MPKPRTYCRSRPPDPERRRGTYLANGRQAEFIAERWLCERGASLIARNFRVRAGEIDRIILHQGCLAAVEVRYRQRPEPVDPLATISQAKCRRLVLALQCFVSARPHYAHRPLRFDIVGISGDLTAPQVQWCIGAFDMDDLLESPF